MWTKSYQDLEGVEEVRGISNTSIFTIGRVVFRNVTITARAQEYFLNVQIESFTKVLYWINMDTSIDFITCKEQNKMKL